MKNIKIIAILLMCICLTACGNNDKTIKCNCNCDNCIDKLQDNQPSSTNNSEELSSSSEDSNEVKFINSGNGYKLNKSESMPIIKIPEDAKNIFIEDDKITYSLVWDWGEISYLYEIDSSITNAPDCEKKVNALMEEKGCPYNKGKNEYSNAYNDSNEGNRTYRFISDNGAGYSCVINKKYYDSKLYESFQDYEFSFSFDELFCEQYTCYDTTTIHYKTSVERWNFIDLYNSLETDIERNQLLKLYPSDIFLGSFYLHRTMKKN